MATGEGEARRLLGVRDGTVLSFQDARRARELVKLAREALDLRLMTEDTFSKAELDRYVFRVWRGVRDRLDAAVSREAPLGAAHFQIDEGTFWRWLRGFMRRCQEGLSDLGVAKIAGDADEDDAEVQP